MKEKIVGCLAMTAGYLIVVMYSDFFVKQILQKALHISFPPYQHGDCWIWNPLLTFVIHVFAIFGVIAISEFSGFIGKIILNFRITK